MKTGLETFNCITETIVYLKHYCQITFQIGYDDVTQPHATSKRADKFDETPSPTYVLTTRYIDN